MHATPTEGPSKAPSGPAALDIVPQQHGPGNVRNQPKPKSAAEGLVSALATGISEVFLLRSV